MTLAETELEMFEKYQQKADDALSEGQLNKACQYLQQCQ